VSESKCSLLLRSLKESPGDLRKDNIANDIEWPLKVISNVQSQIHIERLDVICQKLFLRSQSIRPTVMMVPSDPAIVKFLVVLVTSI